MKKAICLLSVLALIISTFAVGYAQTGNITVNVDFSSKTHTISNYIYGINDFALFDDATSIRQGGNRYTGYNWENNYSNAGSDWNQSSDTYLPGTIPTQYRNTPACMPLYLSKQANGRYKVATLQMAGYVAKDKNGSVSENDTAPSSRWVQVKATKGSAFSLTPDTNDNYVYMDEYVNYLVQTLGDAGSENGINGYLLDNEPALWSSTHPRLHSQNVTCNELIAKSVELAKAVKAVDSKAEIYGPALYGMSAYDNLQDASDMDDSYDWFVSYYLDKMRKASEEYGTRLLDVFDIHYYTEAKGTCRVTDCDDTSHTDCIKARLQSVRTLCEEGYYENSWIGKWRKQSLPVLKRVQESVDKYYPGTKISLTEYSFGGGSQISGAIAEADALGTFAQMNVYLATLWDNGEYQKSAISLYTNYDSNGSCFGDIFVSSKSSDIEVCSSYASIHKDTGNANLVLTNKSLTDSQNITVNLNNADGSFEKATIWGIENGSSKIKNFGTVEVKNNTLNVNLPALCVVNIELAKSNQTTDTSTEDTSTEDTSTEDTSTEDTSTEDTSTEDTSTEIKNIKGDVNNDGSIDVIDIALVRSDIVGSRSLLEIDEHAILRADMNDDGSIDIIDVVLIRKEVIT